MIKPKINKLSIVHRSESISNMIYLSDGRICIIGKQLIDFDIGRMWVADTSIIKKFKSFERIDVLVQTITFDGEYPLTKIGWFRRLKTALNVKFNTVKQYIGIK